MEISLTRAIIEDLQKIGVDTFFGVQGGAIARFIHEIEAVGSHYVPVLNEQAAGYCAEGYFFSCKKPAGILATTGPGVTNALSGVASCYYDNVPLIFLVGQVGLSLNQASKYGVKMVGFQELPHLEILDPVVDFCLPVKNQDDYFSKRKQINEALVYDNRVIALEVNDDVQRLPCRSRPGDFENSEVTFRKPRNIGDEVVHVDIIILGAGAVDLSDQSIRKINATNVPVVVTWGAQNLSSRLDNFVGIFGTHCPGDANKLLAVIYGNLRDKYSPSSAPER